MPGLLADVNLQGHLPYLERLMQGLGLLDVLHQLGLTLATFRDLTLDPSMNDRALWHYCQANQWVLFTDNRNRDDENSLEATLQDSWRDGHLPILTLARKADFENSASYAIQVAEDVADLLFSVFHEAVRDRPADIRSRSVAGSTQPAELTGLRCKTGGHPRPRPQGVITVPMTHAEALDVLAACRSRHLVITTHGSVDAWVGRSDTSLDLAYVPASMGQAPALGLGLALAQARHGVVVVCGDGHLLMNLGCLITLAEHPADVFLIVIDNGVYEVTGGQPTPGAGRIDFPGLARSAGIRRVYACQTLGEWQSVADTALAGPGPVVICLKVEARPGQKAPTAMPPMAKQLARLRAALRDESGVDAVRDRSGKQPAGAIPAAMPTGPITLRVGVRPGDLGQIVYLHGTIYAQERGFDPAFEAYVAGPLSDFVRSSNERQRLWIAERDGQIVGCIAIVAAAPSTAQLRWFLVDPRARGAGLGKRLLTEAIAFCRACGYAEVILWTESTLAAAAHLYRAAGFRKTEEKPGRLGGVAVVEEKYELRLDQP